MKSTAQSPTSGDSMAKKRNDDSSAVDRRKVSKTDGSSTPAGTKRQSSDSIDRSSVITTDVPTGMPRRSNLNIDDSSKSIATDGLSHTVVKPAGQGSHSSAFPTKRHGKGIVSDESSDDTMFFADVTHGPHESELRFRLLHFWEARNPRTKSLIGEEMLLIDEKGTAIQGFIPPGRVDTYVPHLKAGSVYKLRKFFGSRSKENFRVADHNVTVSFSWNSVLTLLKDDPVPFPVDRFRFHSHSEFEANCDRRGDLYDFVGHIKVVEEKTVADCPRLDEAEIAANSLEYYNGK